MNYHCTFLSSYCLLLYLQILVLTLVKKQRQNPFIEGSENRAKQREGSVQEGQNSAAQVQDRRSCW